METDIRSLAATDLRIVTTAPLDQVGALGQTMDNRLFRYSSIGSSSVGAGLCVCTPASPANFAGLSIPTAVTAGPNATSLVITMAGTNPTQDQFNEGTLNVISGTGAGTAYRIKGNSLATSTTGPATFYLYEPIWQNLDTTSKVTVIPNPWENLATNTSAGSGADNARVAGVATVPMGANTWGWVQTNGLGDVQSDGTAIVYQGLGVKLSANTAGQVATATGSSDADKQIVGIAYSHVNNALTNFFPCYLQIG